MKIKKQWLIVILALALTLSLCMGVFIACDNEHKCESKCDECGLCTNLSCEEEACQEKCKGHDNIPSNPEYIKDMDIEENAGEFEDYTLPRGANERQVVVYWREKGHDYVDNDLWLWEVGGAEGRAFEFHPCKYGAKAIVNVPAETKQVGYIVRKDATTHGTSWGDAGKVVDGDRFITLTGDVTEVYLTGANQYLFVSSNGGKTLTMLKAVNQMTIESFTEIKYDIVPKITVSKSQVTVKCDGQQDEVDSVSSFSGTIRLKNEVDLSKTYEVTIEGYDAKVALPLGVFDSKAFGDKYNYEGDDLGANIVDGSVIFKLWAPTASKVVLNLYEKGNGGAALQSIDLGNKPGEFGVWTYEVEHKDDVVGKYYTYTVTTSAGAQEAVDPYAKSAGLNGERGMVIDLADTTPMNNQVVELDSYTDAVIWETHVRDFSNNIEQSQYKGKYLAFTETGLTNKAGIPVGVDYVKNLGITHIHLLPVFDFKSVDESATTPQFNWGYDPQNYNVPEGSYSSDATRGEVRVNEFKQMVDALHAQGLGVVMDMVYNHTYDKNSNLNKVVPNYYYRYNSDGTNSSGSGCGNDTASERYMFGKYMVDSVTYWVKEYKLDGLRFDLMGLHDVETMQKIEKAVHEINPNAIIYGEGWTRTTAKAPGTVLATQGNIKKITATEGSAGAISVFNDVIRDGLRGSVFDAEAKGYLNNASNSAKVQFGLLGGEKTVTGSGADWTVTNASVINYISAHDNHTLWDRLATNSADDSEDVRLAMNRLGATIVMLSKGTPFMTAGEEMLRSKPNSDGTFNSNSYNSSDEVNNLKWESLTSSSNEYAMLNYYSGLISMRKGFDFLRNKETVISVQTVKVPIDPDNSAKTRDGLVVTYSQNEKVVAVAIINGAAAEYSYTLPADAAWSLVCNGTQAGTTALSGATSETAVIIPARSACLYVDSSLLA